MSTGRPAAKSSQWLTNVLSVATQLTFAINLLAATLLTGTASAEMSQVQLKTAQHVAMQVAEKSVEFEMCGVDATALRDQFRHYMEKCDEDARQNKYINLTLDHVYAAAKERLKQEGFHCYQSKAETSENLEQLLSVLDHQIVANECR